MNQFGHKVQRVEVKVWPIEKKVKKRKTLPKMVKGKFLGTFSSQNQILQVMNFSQGVGHPCRVETVQMI